MDGDFAVPKFQGGKRLTNTRFTIFKNQISYSFFKEAVISPLIKLLVKHSRRNFFLDNLCMGAKKFEKTMHMSRRLM